MRISQTLLLAATLISRHAATQRSVAPQQHVPAAVTRIAISQTGHYRLQAGRFGAVWVDIGSELLMASGITGRHTVRHVGSGNAGYVHPSAAVQFGKPKNGTGQLVIVLPRGTHQEFTILPIVIDKQLEDASGRNLTLFVALENCRIRDIRNSGDESEWIGGEPRTISLRAGGTAWIAPGIHHFQNLGSTPAKLVGIEW